MPPKTGNSIQTQPHSTEAERTTIGALLLDSDRIIDVAPILTSNDFYDPVYASIYEAIERLYDERTPIDFVTVSDALKDNQKLQQIGGSAFLAELTAEVPTSSHAEKYAEIIREKSLRRKLAKAGTSIADLAATDGKNSAELMEQAEQQILSLSRHTAQSKPRSIVDIAPERYDHYTMVHEADDPAAHFGITTGFTTLDNLLTGLQPSHLMILAGRPSMGSKRTCTHLDLFATNN